MNDILIDSAEREAIRGFRGYDKSPSENTRFVADKNLLVRAGAGSGKTTALVERMVALVRCGIPVNKIVAITFTRKAASEMRERFFLALSECRDTLEKAPDGVESDLASETAHARETARVQEALHSIDTVFIDTIHAFCLRLLMERPMAAGISPDFTVVDEREEAKFAKKFWNRFLSRTLAPGSVEYTAFREAGIDASSLYTYFISRSKKAHIPVPNEHVNLPDLREAVDKMLETVALIEDILPASVKKDGVMRLIEDARMFLEVRTIERHRDQAELLQKMDGLVKEGQNGNATGGLKTGALMKRSWYTKKADPIAERVDQIMEEADVSESAYSIPLCVAEFVRPALEEWQVYLHNIIAPIVSDAVDQYAVIRKKMGKITFNDLLVVATEMLRDFPSVRAHFSGQFSRLLIDEFQDTDPTQAELLFLLTATNVREKSWLECVPKPGSLFIVGDAKQSIYRFRDADLRIFETVEKLIRKTDGLVLTLEANFRAAPALCTWNNQAMAPLFGVEAPPYQAVYNDLVPAPQNSAMSGMVIQLATGKVPRNNRAVVATMEAELIARNIRAAHDSECIVTDLGSYSIKKLQYGDVMILVREWNQMQTYADALQRYSIPYNMTGGKALGHSSVLPILTDLLDAVLNPLDAVATTAFLKGPLAGLSDAALYRFVSAGGSLTGEWVVPEKITGEHRERLTNAFDTLRNTRQLLTKSNVSDALSQILINTGLMATICLGPGGSAAAGSLQRIIALVRVWEGAGLSWAEVILELHRLQEGQISEEGMTLEIGLGTAVQLLNIHQAKGLEARIVFLADPLGGQPRKSVDAHVSRGTGGARLLMPVVEKYNYSAHTIAVPQGWQDARQEEIRFETAEKDRLLYVAATRAAEVLVVSRYTGYEDEGKESTGAWVSLYKGLDVSQAPRLAGPSDEQLIEQNTEDVADLDSVFNTLSEAREHITLLSKPTYFRKIASDLAGHSLAPTKSAKPPDSPFLGSRYGTLIHRLFEWHVRQKTDARSKESDDEVYEADGTDMTVPGKYIVQEFPDLTNDKLSELTRTTKDDLDRFLHSGIWKSLSVSEEVHTEISFSVRSEEDGIPGVLAGIIDLVFRVSDGWCLVDYKTDQLTPEGMLDRYGTQVDAYVSSWEKLTGEKVIEHGFYAVKSGEWITKN